MHAEEVPLARKFAEGDVEQNALLATLKSKDGRDKLQLKNIDGQWKVDIGALIQGRDVSAIVPMFRAVGTASRKLADEIESGKCKTVDEARTGMAKLLETAVTAEKQAQIEAATKPAVAEPVGTGTN